MPDLSLFVVSVTSRDFVSDVTWLGTHDLQMCFASDDSRQLLGTRLNDSHFCCFTCGENLRC